MQSLSCRLAQPDRSPWPDRPVRVALVITELDVGGAERALVSLATGLDRRFWEPHVHALGPEAPLAEPLRAAGIPVECLSVNRRRPIHAIHRLARSLRAFGPDLVQSFLFHANLAARLAALRAGRPWVVGGLRVAEREKAWHLRLDRLTIRLTCGEVCVSEGVRRFSIETAHLPPDRLTVIPNGIDPSPIDRAPALDRASLGIPPTAHLALFVGRLTPQKGVDLLLDAAEQVIAARPDWHLAIAGAGPDQAALQARSDRSSLLTGHVHWLGQRSDIPSLLKAADLLVLPSLWEGMPNVVLEAMSAALPVVASAVEGTEDLVETGRTGWLVPPGDRAALASALIDAASDPERLSLLSAPPAAFGSRPNSRPAASSPLTNVSGQGFWGSKVLPRPFPEPSHDTKLRMIRTMGIRMTTAVATPATL